MKKKNRIEIKERRKRDLREIGVRGALFLSLIFIGCCCAGIGKGKKSGVLWRNPSTAPTNQNEIIFIQFVVGKIPPACDGLPEHMEKRISLIRSTDVMSI